MDFFKESISKKNIIDVCDIKKNDKVLVVGMYHNMIDDLLLKGCYVDVLNENINNKYDKIIIYGIDSKFEHLLRFLKSLLKENGYIFIACDNKYGMKFFNGVKYNNDYYSGILGDCKLFSCYELRKIIKDSGLKCYFYYPLPEYELPFEIYSEDYLPSVINNVGHSFKEDRYIFFDENKALVEANRSGVFEMFANSYLIKCW